MAVSYDVVVVGGGPAGSSAALQAASAGASVLMVEREPQIATTVRTSGVTWSSTVSEFGIPRRCYNPVKNYGFVSPCNEVVVRDETSRAVVLDVRETYRWLASEAEGAGAEVLTGVSVGAVSRNHAGIVLEGSGGFSARGSVVIDASGFGSVVAQGLGMVESWRRFGAGAEYEMHAPDADQETWWLMVGNMYSPAGYAWIFPVGRDLVRIGVGVAKPECAADPRELLDGILRDRRGPVGGLGEMRPVEYHYGLIPNGGIGRRSVYDNVMLVGDSAGQANPLVLEGIRYAIQFGTAGRRGCRRRGGFRGHVGSVAGNIRDAMAAGSRITHKVRIQGTEQMAHPHRFAVGRGAGDYTGSWRRRISGLCKGRVWYVQDDAPCSKTSASCSQATLWAGASVMIRSAMQ